MVGGLTNHLKMRHPNQAEFKCFEHCHFDCEEKFQNYWDLVNHIRNHYNINNKSEKETNFEKKCYNMVILSSAVQQPEPVLLYHNRY